MFHHLYLHLAKCALLCVALLGGLSCSRDLALEELEARQGTFVAFSVATPGESEATRAGTVNTNTEDQLNSLRIIACDHATGAVKFNERFSSAAVTTQPDGATTVWHSPFEFLPGTYDFFFVANEDSWSLTSSLTSLTNSSQFFDRNSVFNNLVVPINFRPTAAKPMLYTQVIPNVTITRWRNGKGTSSDPQHFVAFGDEMVNLVRTLAKFNFTFKKVVKVDNVGGTLVPKFDFQYLPNAQQILFSGMPRHFTLFNSAFFDGATAQYTPDFYQPLAAPYDDAVVVESSPATLIQNSTSTYTQASSITTPRFDYTNVFYLPEKLIPLIAGKENIDHTTSVPYDAKGISMLYRNNAGLDVYKFSVWQKDIHENREILNNTPLKYFELDKTKYSTFSVQRNHAYDITAEEAPTFLLTFDVQDWEDNSEARYYVFSNFNVVVKQPTFPGGSSEVYLVQTYPDVTQAPIELRPISGAFSSPVNPSDLSGGNIAVTLSNDLTISKHKYGAVLTPTTPPTSSTPIIGVYRYGTLIYTIQSHQ